MYWQELRGSPLTDDQLAELGRQNLSQLLRELSTAEKAESRAHSHWDSELALLKGLKPDTSDFAIDYDALLRPLPFPPGELFVLDSPDFLYGNTNFTICGACQHWNRSSCRLLPGHRTSQDTPCVLHHGDHKQQAIEAIGAKASSDLGGIAERRQEIRGFIERVSRARNASKSMPLLPCFRGARCYRFGDRVLVYTGFSIFGELRTRWAPGTVLRAYEHNWDQVAVLLDQPLLPPDTYANKSVQASWAPSMWYVSAHTPFVLRRSELDALAKLPEENLLRQRWSESAKGHGVDDPRNSSRRFEVDPATFGRDLDPSLALPSQKERRLMSGAEAAAALGFKRGYWPTSVKAVVARYRRLKNKKGADPGLLDRARSTLLLRFPETEWMGGD